ncbi:MAG: RNB domain-containing ribonuclease [Spirochaetaceae bacterium]|nr:RNB domain-containing ribonuclease [Spirochaetaceae bacterium]
MFVEKSLAVYRGKPALVTASGDKIEIELPGGERVRVREKDLELLHPGPAARTVLSGEDGPAGDIRGVWELLTDTAVSLREFAELLYGAYSPESAWAAYVLLREGLYFTGTIGAIRSRPREEVEAGERKRDGKEKDARERQEFLARLTSKSLRLPDDRRFLQDVEALAFGTSAKSRTLKELGRGETEAEAHRILLGAGVWDEWVNPHPSRLGCSAVSAREAVDPPPAETRRDLSFLRSYAVDNAWSADPDDAVSIEEGAGDGAGPVIYVHVADPAASVLPGTPADNEARGRGATLYLPEGASRMLAPEALEHYALGIHERSPALTFRLALDRRGEIAETDIFPSLVRVTRLSYEDAGRLAAGEAAGNQPRMETDEARRDLAALIAWSRTNLRRRIDAGAVVIELPEVHIAVDTEHRRISIEETVSGPAAVMVRECMLLAGEGAARWASRRQLAFPFVSQETGDLPGTALPGLAGAYQLRRCMRPRALSVKPGLHWGLGLDQYSQVTSPLRRYTDLLAHQQLRAALGTEAYRDVPPRSAAEMTVAMGAGEAAYQAAVHAERASRAHWTAVYLASRKDEVWEAVVLEKKGNRAVVIIPALGLETQVSLKAGNEPNSLIRLALVSTKIPEAEAVFEAV